MDDAKMQQMMAMMDKMQAMMDKMRAMMNHDDMETMRAMNVDMSDPRAQKVYAEEKRKMNHG